MAGNKVEICGVDTSTLPTLSHERMRALLERAQAGDFRARDELIHANLRLVLSVIQRFQNRGENVDDLFQVGCIGLMKGLDNFDLSMNVRLSTYCVPMIIGEIRRYLRDNNPIRVSRSMRDTAYRALRTRDQLAARDGREPTVAEIAREMDASEEDVVALARGDSGADLAVRPDLSKRRRRDLRHGSGARRARQRGGMVRDLSIRQALDHLAQRERKIIERRFFQGRTQMEVADEIGISQAQVSRLEKAALKQMRKYMG